MPSKPRPAGPKRKPVAGTGARQDAITAARAQPPAGALPRPDTAGRTKTAAVTSPLRRQELRLAGAPRRQRPLWPWLAALAALAILAGVAALVLMKRSDQPSQLGALEVYQAPTGFNDHRSEGTVVSYANTPPSSGAHYPAPAAWGFAAQPVKTSVWVHNLEHGGIVVLFRCDTACPDLEKQMSEVYNQLPVDPQFQERKAVVTPYPNLDHLVRVQAWGWTLPLDKVDSQLINAFYNEHVNKGPEKLP